MKQCMLFELSMMSQCLVDKEFKIKENYTNTEGNHPQAGDGINASDLVLDKSELTSDKLLINSNSMTRQNIERHIEFLKKHRNRFFVF